MLVISTRTTAREVKRNWSTTRSTRPKRPSSTRCRSSADTPVAVRKRPIVSAPDDLSGIVSEAETVLQEHDGKLRVTFDSLTELIYYADEDGALSAVEDILDLLDEYDAVGMSTSPTRSTTRRRSRRSGNSSTVSSNCPRTEPFRPSSRNRHAPSRVRRSFGVGLDSSCPSVAQSALRVRSVSTANKNGSRVPSRNR